MLVGFPQRQIAVHTDVHLDGDAVADTTGAKIVRFRDIGEGADDVFYFLFHLVRQRMVGQLADAALQQIDRHLHQHSADDDGCHRVEDCPPMAQQDGSADADGCADRREGVAPVMPGIGHDSLRVQLPASAYRITIQRFLDHD